MHRDDPIRRARAYAAGGAAAISVLCEPHWFGGSLVDLARRPRGGRRSRSSRRSSSSTGASSRSCARPARTWCCCSRRCIAAAGLSALVREARDLGLEPLVEAHDERELDAALATDARVIGINNRDLRTLAVDPERAARLRERDARGPDRDRRVRRA